MKTWLIPLIGLTLALAVACGDEATTTPSPTATVSPAATPTPSPVKEWAIDGVHVDGSTVTVLLHVFAGIDVRVTLDGRVPDQINAPIPILEHVFQDVAPGQHTIEVRDVVGFSETAQVVVQTLTTTKSPTDGLCLPAVPLAVSVGDTWIISGPVKVTGGLPTELPVGAAKVSITFTVDAIGTTIYGGRGDVPIEHPTIQLQVTNVTRDADGNVLSTEDDPRVARGISWTPASVSNLGPALTPDWECHKEAWLNGWPPEAQPSIGERVLSSGMTAVVFTVRQHLLLPDLGIDATNERHHGYDRLTGRVVLQETRSTGTRNGEPFNVEMLIELVSEPKDPTIINDGQIDKYAWLRDLIRRLESEPVANPPVLIAQYEYHGQTVYYLPPRCCDIFSDLYDATGVIIGHPDGGIIGQGDGRVPDFLEVRENENVVWRDQRSYDPGLVQVPAPIESVELLIMESFPPQYSLVVVSGLPNGCASFAGYRLERGGDTVSIEMLNWKPADPQVACTDNYRTVETRIPLGSKFDPDTTYTVHVNAEVVALING